MQNYRDRSQKNLQEPSDSTQMPASQQKTTIKSKFLDKHEPANTTQPPRDESWVRCCELVRRQRGRQQEKNFRTSGDLFNGLTPLVADPRIDPPLGTCFNCWEPNHFVWQCPYPKTGEEYCVNCGRRYVYVENCPRCSNSYKSYSHSFRRNLVLNIAQLASTGRSSFTARSDKSAETNQLHRPPSKATAAKVEDKSTQCDIESPEEEHTRVTLNQIRELMASTSHLSPSVQEELIKRTFKL